MTGTVRVDAAQVEAIAGQAALGRPLAVVDVGSVREQVAAMPLVLEVAVERRWPRTLEVVVTERVAVAAVPAAGGVAVVDEQGVVLATQPEPPPGVPLLRVDVERDGAGTLAAARAVLAAMPVQLQQRTGEVSATSPADVRLVVDGKQVRWGTAEDSARKVEVLTGLLATVPGVGVRRVGAVGARRHALTRGSGAHDLDRPATHPCRSLWLRASLPTFLARRADITLTLYRRVRARRKAASRTGARDEREGRPWPHRRTT